MKVAENPDEAKPEDGPKHPEQKQGQEQFHSSDVVVEAAKEDSDQDLKYEDDDFEQEWMNELRCFKHSPLPH